MAANTEHQENETLITQCWAGMLFCHRNTWGESTTFYAIRFLCAKKSLLKSSVKGVRFDLPFFLVTKLAAVRPEVEHIIQKGAKSLLWKHPPWLVLCYLGYDSSEVIGGLGLFCSFNLICLQEKSLECVVRIIFLRIIL